MSVPAGLKYTLEHEWIKTESENIIRLGITDFAQSELGDVVFADLPDQGKSLKKGDSVCTVESVKAVSDVYAPVDGIVTKVNSKLSTDSQLINQEPYDSGWIVEMQVSDKSQLNELLDASQYSNHLSSISK